MDRRRWIVGLGLGLAGVLAGPGRALAAGEDVAADAAAPADRDSTARRQLGELARKMIELARTVNALADDLRARLAGHDEQLARLNRQVVELGRRVTALEAAAPATASADRPLGPEE